LFIETIIYLIAFTAKLLVAELFLLIVKIIGKNKQILKMLGSDDGGFIHFQKQVEGEGVILANILHCVYGYKAWNVKGPTLRNG
jgi:hypothetical protein